MIQVIINKILTQSFSEKRQPKNSHAHRGD